MSALLERPSPAGSPPWLPGAQDPRYTYEVRLEACRQLLRTPSSLAAWLRLLSEPDLEGRWIAYPRQARACPLALWAKTILGLRDAAVDGILLHGVDPWVHLPPYLPPQPVRLVLPAWARRFTQAVDQTAAPLLTAKGALVLLYAATREDPDDHPDAQEERPALYAGA